VGAARRAGKGHGKGTGWTRERDRLILHLGKDTGKGQVDTPPGKGGKGTKGQWTKERDKGQRDGLILHLGKDTWERDMGKGQVDTQHQSRESWGQSWGRAGSPIR
jgi:hypothetical protein